MKRGTINHPKMIELSTTLCAHRAHAVGIMTMLWDWAGEYTPDGNIGKYSNKVIASAVGWPEDDADRLIDALVSCRWLDKTDGPDRLQIHDWHEHRERWVEMRETRKRTASAQCAHSERTAPAPAPAPAPAEAEAEAPAPAHAPAKKSGPEKLSLTVTSVSDSPEREAARVKFKGIVARLYAIDDPNQSRSDRTTADKVFACLWDDDPEHSQARVASALAHVQEARIAKKPMAWFIDKLKRDGLLTGDDWSAPREVRHARA